MWFTPKRKLMKFVTIDDNEPVVLDVNNIKGIKRQGLQSGDKFIEGCVLLMNYGIMFHVIGKFEPLVEEIYNVRLP